MRVSPLLPDKVDPHPTSATLAQQLNMLPARLRAAAKSSVFPDTGIKARVLRIDDDAEVRRNRAMLAETRETGRAASAPVKSRTTNAELARVQHAQVSRGMENFHGEEPSPDVRGSQEGLSR